MLAALELIFWLCLMMLAQTYIFYKISLCLIKVFRPLPSPKSPANNPKISVIIAAHNEEDAIEEKIKNTLAQDYPKDKMDILIGDDGSSDKTLEIAERYSSQIRLLKNGKNEGKAAMLNKLHEEAAGEIFLFSDANTVLESDALRNLAAEFANERVGCVCGQLLLKSESGSNLSKTESFYWKGESSLKALESNFGAVMGSNGALYAIRSELYTKLPTHKTVMDDFYITAKILLKNYHCVFCEKARAFENTSALKFGEFKRKVRIGRANFNFLFDFLPLLNPLHPMRAYMFLSHKLLRWISPFLLLGVFACSVLLMHEHVFYKAFFASELLFVVLAILGVKAFRYFLTMNFALLLGFCKSLCKEKGGAWERIMRAEPKT